MNNPRLEPQKAELNAKVDQCNDNKQQAQNDVDESTEAFGKSRSRHHFLQDMSLTGTSDYTRDTVQAARHQADLSLHTIRREQSLIDRTDPKTEPRDLILNQQACDSKMTCMSQVDYIIAQTNGPLPTFLSNSCERVRQNYNKVTENLRTLSSHVEEGLALKESLDALNEEALPNKEGSPDDKDDKSDKGGSGGSGGPGPKPESSGSLVEDFADPNLEQPSYMDPED